MKKWLCVLAYVFFIIGFIVICENLISNASEYSKVSYNKNLYHLAVIFANIIFGLLLGLGNIVNEKNKKGTWIIDTPKLFFLLLPSLLLNLYFIILIYNISWIKNIPILYKIFSKTTITTNIISIILGYSFISIFKKIDNS